MFFLYIVLDDLDSHLIRYVFILL